MMKEKPILMSTEMVLAILEGRKTQTRRIVKPQPIDSIEVDGNLFEGNHKGYVKVDGHPNWKEQFVHEFCRYKVGDLLWVRETWQRKDTEEEKFVYRADGELWEDFIWKPSIFMPKNACRIFLEITNIKVERLQDISEEDAKAEGAEKVWQDERGNFWYPASETIRAVGEHGNHKVGFNSIWNGINGIESWNTNPWVWVIEFKVISTTGRPDIPSFIPRIEKKYYK